MSKQDEPVLGVPYTGATAYPRQYNQQPQQPGGAAAYMANQPGCVMYNQQPQQPPQQQYFYVAQNPYQAGMIPPNAIFDDPRGVPITQTFYRDTPAPFSCLHCGHSSLSSLKSKPSLAAFVGCMMPFFLGVCFLCPSMDCLWHKYHYCPSCGEKVGEFEKSDVCIVMDPPNWEQKSFALTG